MGVFKAEDSKKVIAVRASVTRRACLQCGSSAWVLTWIRHSGLCGKCYGKAKREQQAREVPSNGRSGKKPALR